MTPRSYDERRRLESLPREELEAWQLRRLNGLLEQILPANRFYAEKLAGNELPLKSLEDLSQLPFTFKDELLAKQHHGVAANLTYPRDRYVRFHQTSGTRGRPLVVLDTADDWRNWSDIWQHVFDAAEVAEADAIFFAFSFGPYIGFWSALEAAADRGCLVVPAGGMSTPVRLEMMRNCGASAVCCTPSYALHMAEVAAERKLDVRRFGVRTFLLAGEPGGSVPAVRETIERAWGARVIDHAGASEVGPWGFGDSSGEGLYILETDFIAEFLSVETGAPADDGELAELVITSLFRPGLPVIRYRTGDLVRPLRDHSFPRRFVFLQEGVVGRTDDMLIIRGVNIFPSALDQILRGFPEVVEYRVTARSEGAMDVLEVEVEDRLHQPERVADELRIRLGLNVVVVAVPIGSLPRFEGKGRRVVDSRRRG
ncbi:MAG: phenylacetate--CoA ligase family protein [Planctomycetaceae bacterium]|nr:phenylacetate--CoA ligase family protein [Planctomycetaceae bacterium]